MSTEHSTVEARLIRLERLQNTLIVIAVIQLFLICVVGLQVFFPEVGSGIRAAFNPARISEGINVSFGPILKPFFHPIDHVLTRLSHVPGLARILPSLFAVGYFVGTMIWVFFGLKRDFVNLSAPSPKIWHDLRFWTIVSMLPHIIVYFYFTG